MHRQAYIPKSNTRGKHIPKQTYFKDPRKPVRYIPENGTGKFIPGEIIAKK